MFEDLVMWILGLFVRVCLFLDRQGPRGPYVSTRSERRWYPWRPAKYDVHLVDFGVVAWINRWGGHAGRCTLAQHLVEVAEILERDGSSPWIQLQGLLHDVAEVYPPGDQLRPVLSGPALLTWPIRYLKKLAERAVRERLGMPLRLPVEVKIADSLALQRERQWCFRQPDTRSALKAAGMRPRWEPAYAEWRWWGRVEQLAGECRDWLRKGEGPPLVETSDRIAALHELAIVARSEVLRLQPAALPRSRGGAA